VAAAAKTPAPKPDLKPLKKELDKVDAQMKTLSTERQSLETLLTATVAPAEMAKAGKRLKVVDAELQVLEERWLELTDQIETAAA